jgi:hypothetical protein
LITFINNSRQSSVYSLAVNVWPKAKAQTAAMLARVKVFEKLLKADLGCWVI